MNSQQQKVVAAAGASALAVLVLLWYYRRRSSRKGDDQAVEVDFADLTAADSSAASANASVAEVAVPHYAVGSIIGRGGEVIKQLKKETGTRLDFNDRHSGHANEHDKSDRILSIRGARDKVEAAEMRIKQLLASLPVVRSEDVFVPQNCLGRIIGKGGQSIREMCKMSGAKLTVDRRELSNPDEKQKMTMTGSDDAIELAKALIQEKLREEHQFRNKKSGRYQNNTDAPHISNIKDFPTMKIPNDNDYHKAFVSAFDTPAHIWVQLVSPESSQLDSLTADMTAFYSDDNAAHPVLTADVGAICCAPFELDQDWYRACVTGTFDEDNSVDLYYLDFGDTGRLPLSRIRQMRNEYMSLPAQAVQCRLNGISPADDTWSTESTACFESISHCAQWVPVMIRVVGYQAEGGLHIPLVDIVDTNGDMEVNLKEELITAGHAVAQAEGSQDLMVKDSRKETDRTGNDAMRADEPTALNQDGDVSKSPEAESNVTGQAMAMSKPPVSEDVISEDAGVEMQAAPPELVEQDTPTEKMSTVAAEQSHTQQECPATPSVDDSEHTNDLVQETPSVLVTDDVKEVSPVEVPPTMENANAPSSSNPMMSLVNGLSSSSSRVTDIDDAQSEADSFFSARSETRTPTNMDDFETDTMSYTSARSDARTPTNDFDDDDTLGGDPAEEVLDKSAAPVNRSQQPVPRRKSSNDGYDIILTPVMSDADEEDSPSSPQQSDKKYVIKVIDETKNEAPSSPGVVVGKETTV